MDRLALADALRELGRLLEATGAPLFRVRAHERAARIVEQLPEEDLRTRIEQERLEDLPHVGASLSRKIAQLWHTGTLPELEILRKQVPSGFRELSRIEGLGPKRILTLYQALGIETLEDLQRAIEDKRVREVRGFSAQGEEQLGVALAAARSRTDRHLWVSAVREARRLAPRIREAGAGMVHLAGEARRAQEQLDELKLVATADRPELTARALTGSMFGAVLTSPTVVRAQSGDGMPFEVRFTSKASTPAALLWDTGPLEHVQLLVARARSRGMSLTPEGLFDEEHTPLELIDEASLYEALGLPWVPPERREDPHALQGSEPFDALVELGDLQGVVHCHSTFSDGRNTIEELAHAADELGFAYLTLTDHSPSASYAGGLTTDALQRQWDEIDRVQEQVDVILLKGTESDILADGGLDYPDFILERLDIVIASIHLRHKMDRYAMTRRLVRAMSHPIFKIWGHGLGRLVGRRDPIDCDVEAVLDAMAENRAAVEINSDPHRLDLPPEWVRRARVRGIPFVISADAHSIAGLSVLPFGVGLARRAGVRRDEVLNTLSADLFRERVKPLQAPAAHLR